jgi:DNA-binding MarR family transcriptional regulator
MARKEFVRLMEENIWTLDKIADKLRLDRAESTGYPRQMMSILVRLHNGGRAKLKDIARREHVSAPNLCAAFRKLEADGLVIRTIDENDRRNTWYCVSDAGAELAVVAMDLFRAGVEKVFSNISREDEIKLTEALRTMQNILKKVELSNE